MVNTALGIGRVLLFIAATPLLVVAVPFIMLGVPAIIGFGGALGLIAIGTAVLPNYVPVELIIGVSVVISGSWALIYLVWISSLGSCNGYD